MAKAEYYLHGDFDKVLQSLEAEVFNSVSASLEASSDFQSPSCRCAVRVYERYSWSGGNRVSLNVTLLQSDGRLFCSAIASAAARRYFSKSTRLGKNRFWTVSATRWRPFSDGN